MSCVDASATYRHTLPPAPSLVSTELGATKPVTKLTLEATGRGSAQSHTVTYPVAAASVAVTFSADGNGISGNPATAGDLQGVAGAGAARALALADGVDGRGSGSSSRRRAGTTGE